MSPLLPFVRAETACLEGYLAALDEEDQAISGGRFGQLPAITERKAGLLARLAELDSGRESAQVQLGLEAGRSGAQAAASADPQLREAWAGMLVLAARARESNRRVAAKVHVHLDFTANAIAFLQSRAQPLYGRNGAARPIAGRATIAVG